MVKLTSCQVPRALFDLTCAYSQIGFSLLLDIPTHSSWCTCPMGSENRLPSWQVAPKLFELDIPTHSSWEYLVEGSENRLPSWQVVRTWHPHTLKLRELVQDSENRLSSWQVVKNGKPNITTQITPTGLITLTTLTTLNTTIDGTLMSSLTIGLGLATEPCRRGATAPLSAWLRRQP